MIPPHLYKRIRFVRFKAKEVIFSTRQNTFFAYKLYILVVFKCFWLYRIISNIQSNSLKIPRSNEVTFDGILDLIETLHVVSNWSMDQRMIIDGLES